MGYAQVSMLDLKKDVKLAGPKVKALDICLDVQRVDYAAEKMGFQVVVTMATFEVEKTAEKLAEKLDDKQVFQLDMVEVDHLEDSMVVQQVVKKAKLVVDMLEGKEAEQLEYSKD